MIMRKINKDAKKEIILRKATQVFVRYGYKGASMEEIAKKVKIGKSTIYEYFKDKKELLIYTLKNIEREAYISIRKRLRRAQNPKEKFEMLLLPCRKRGNGWEKLLKIITKLSVEKPEKEIKQFLHRVYERWINLIETIYSEAVKNGILISVDKRNLSLAFAGLSQGFITDISSARNKEKIFNKWKNALSTLLYALRKKNPGISN